MRRPSPLPSPPTPAKAAPKRRARAEAAEPEPSRAAIDETSDVAGAVGPTGVDGPGEPAASSDGRVGVRQVWRAARARRKALRAEVRRFTQRQRRRRAIWLGAAASVGVLVALTFAAAYSPLFGVERITVVGTAQLNASDVEAALSGQLGTPLASVDSSAIKAALVGFPLVESYALEARPPHDLVVRIVERTPVGVVQSAAGFTVVDAAGVALSTAATPPPGQPLLEISAGVGSPAFTSAGRVMRSLPPDIRAQVTTVTASTPDDVAFTLGGTKTTVVWGSADDSAAKATVLARAMVARPPASVTSYDVSSSKAIVIR
ncbi:FtsQ-type POTRA domain-containing protein [Microbacterium sp. CJ88]|uniref:FtsQ-type POTRA domain-containing protein n=1 Tax=Microbacterium sp. CJ88 TaxID=3445672 RepID=UPI003F6553E4